MFQIKSTLERNTASAKNESAENLPSDLMHYFGSLYQNHGFIITVSYVPLYLRMLPHNILHMKASSWDRASCPSTNSPNRVPLNLL